MLQSDSKSPNTDYGSFCNTASESFVPAARSRLGLMNTSVPVSDADVSHTDHVSRHQRGHHRNDSEVPMPNDASRPLLDNNDSSSDEDAISNVDYSRKKSRLRSVANNGTGIISCACSGSSHAAAASNAPGDAVHIDMPSDMDDVTAKASAGQGIVDDSDDESEHHLNIPPEHCKTFLAFIFLIFAWIATTTSLALTHERLPDYKPLPDVFLDNVPYQSWGLSASEIIIIASVWVAFFVAILHKYRSIVLRRIFLLVALHYYYRAITMYITVLPKSNENYMCVPKSNETTATDIVFRVLNLLSGMGLSINGKHVYCGDYIYSGHTMTLMMAYLVISEYSPKNWFLLHWTALCTSIVGVLMLLLARGHYSIDVVIAYWITTRLWWMYHTMANNACLKGDIENSSNFLSRMWWWLLFRYFERNVPCNLPRKYSCPLPKCLLKLKPCQVLRNSCLRKKSSSPGAVVLDPEDNRAQS